MTCNATKQGINMNTRLVNNQATWYSTILVASGSWAQIEWNVWTIDVHNSIPSTKLVLSENIKAASSQIELCYLRFCWSSA